MNVSCMDLFIRKNRIAKFDFFLSFIRNSTLISIESPYIFFFWFLFRHENVVILLLLSDSVRRETIEAAY